MNLKPCPYIRCRHICKMLTGLAELFSVWLNCITWTVHAKSGRLHSNIPDFWYRSTLFHMHLPCTTPKLVLKLLYSTQLVLLKTIFRRRFPIPCHKYHTMHHSMSQICCKVVRLQRTTIAPLRLSFWSGLSDVTNRSNVIGSKNLGDVIISIRVERVFVYLSRVEITLVRTFRNVLKSCPVLISQLYESKASVI